MKHRLLAIPLLLAGLNLSLSALADEFNADDLKRWQAGFMSTVKSGEKLFHGGINNPNTMSCDQCHPNAANTHPETYPKFQQQLGKVAVLGEMINWCIRNPLKGKPLALDSDDMAALQAYITWERRGVALAPGKH